MKKLILVLVTVLATLAVGYSQKTKDFVYLGQMYGTFEHATQTMIKGKVNEFKQRHFWAEEVDGKIVKGKAITVEENKTLPLAFVNFTEEYNPEGIVKRSISYDFNGKVLQDIKVEAEREIIKKSEYYTSDTLTAYVKYKYAGRNLVEAIAYNPINDTIYMSVRYAYDPNGKIIKTETFDYNGNLQSYSLRTRNERGLQMKIENYNKEGKLTSQYDNKYNDKDERIETHQKVFISGLVSDFTFKYEYDKMGNNTVIVFLKDNKPFIYRVREIKYFD